MTKKEGQSQPVDPKAKTIQVEDLDPQRKKEKEKVPVRLITPESDLQTRAFHR